MMPGTRHGERRQADLRMVGMGCKTFTGVMLP
jgi:hypothetical protein